MSGSLKTNPNYGQAVSNAGPNAAPGTNGCVYPTTVPTLFNQLDAAGVSWKGYAQDLNTTTTPVSDASGPTHSQGEDYCGAPYKSPAATGTTTQPNPGGANATDQYVPKHFPFPWFQSISAAGDCNAKHIANLFDTSNGLYHDLQKASTTPAFSWISPNNCSDAHDAVCHGNNLSGGFKDPNTPNPPVNYTGGLYASDLFLEHVIPEIEASPAFKQGGLIDITFDEGFPPFTYTGNSFANATNVSPNALASIQADSAAETINGHRVDSEPTGPNTPLATDANGYQLYPGPGYNAFIDRPASCNAACLGGGSAIQGASTETASAASGATEITDSSAVATDVGRSVTGSGIPSGAFVGQVFNNPNTPTSPNGAGGNDLATTGAFTIVDQNGAPLKTTAALTGTNNVVLGARTAQTDPLYDATDPTTGGGDTGSVLISPFIDPGTVSNVAYNHYSWLRTMEDLFAVAKASPVSTARATSATPRSPVSHRSARTCSPTPRAGTADTTTDAVSDSRDVIRLRASGLRARRSARALVHARRVRARRGDHRRVRGPAPDRPHGCACRRRAGRGVPDGVRCQQCQQHLRNAAVVAAQDGGSRGAHRPGKRGPSLGRDRGRYGRRPPGRTHARRNARWPPSTGGRTLPPAQDDPVHVLSDPEPRQRRDPDHRRRLDHLR